MTVRKPGPIHLNDGSAERRAFGYYDEHGSLWERESADALWTRTFSEHGVDDPLRDFLATYFARDDDATRQQVMDFLDRIVARYTARDKR
jgi:hypothetical protein